VEAILKTDSTWQAINYIVFPDGIRIQAKRSVRPRIKIGANDIEPADWWFPIIQFLKDPLQCKDRNLVAEAIKNVLLNGSVSAE